MSDYSRAVERLEDLYHGPILPASQVGLLRAGYLMERLGNPHRDFCSVHVAGSSGKGSTTTMVGSILMAAGFRTGLFRSPHLRDYTERVTVDGADIPREDFARITDRVWPIVEEMRSNHPPGYELGRPSLFEVLFAVGATYLQEQAVEWAAVETGLGGRLDATNLLDSDVAVITSISLEHTHVLGDTLAKIAAEKAAIIKPGCSAVTAVEPPEALSVIEDRASAVGAPLIEVPRDVQYMVESEDLEGQTLHLAGGMRSVHLRIPALGEFQARNAATAFGAFIALQRRGVEVADNAVTKGLAAASAAGRFEIVERHPLVIVDGAHNPDACKQLAASVARLLPDRRIVLLFAAMRDKNIEEMAGTLSAVACTVYCCDVPGSGRGASASYIADIFRRYGSDAVVVPDAKQAYDEARGALGPDDALLITGSMYHVGLLRERVLAEVVP